LILGNSARDAAMAHAFQAIWELEHPGTRVLIWAHDSHVVKNASEHVVLVPALGMELPWGEKNLGELLHDSLGDDYVSVALHTSLYTAGSEEFPLPEQPESTDDPLVESLLRVRGIWYDDDWLWHTVPSNGFNALIFIDEISCYSDWLD
jgi:erythromycin esterase-like protein